MNTQLMNEVRQPDVAQTLTETHMQIADIQAIERLLSDFAWFADRGDGARLSALFLPEGTLTVGGIDLHGREEIAVDCCRRVVNGRKTRHVWSNLRVESSETNEISTTAIQMTFEQREPEKPTQLRLNDVFDCFRRDADGSWRFARRVIQREMALEI
jgi:hypothetical protein